MRNTFTAVIKKVKGWWIGWIEEVPGVNCQEKTREELIKTLSITLKEAIQLKPNYRDPRYALAVYYVQKAKDATDTTTKAQYQDMAKEMLMFNLQRIDPSDKQSKELLDSIK